MLLVAIGFTIYKVADFSVNSTQRCASCKIDKTSKEYLQRFGIQLLPSVCISVINMIFPILLRNVSFGTYSPQLHRLRLVHNTYYINRSNNFFSKQITRFEKLQPNTRMTLTLIRTLVVRLLSITFAGYRYYTATYCNKIENSCSFCAPPVDKSTPEKSLCFESEIGAQIYLYVKNYIKNVRKYYLINHH